MHSLFKLSDVKDYSAVSEKVFRVRSLWIAEIWLFLL